MALPPSFQINIQLPKRSAPIPLIVRKSNPSTLGKRIVAEVRHFCVNAEKSLSLNERNTMVRSEALR